MHDLRLHQFCFLFAHSTDVYVIHFNKEGSVMMMSITNDQAYWGTTVI